MDRPPMEALPPEKIQLGLRKSLTTIHFVGIGLYNTFRPL